MSLTDGNFMRVLKTTWINLGFITTVRDYSTDDDEEVKYSIALWFSDGADPLELTGDDALRVMTALGLPVCVTVKEES